MKKALAFLTILAALIWSAVFYFPDNQLHLIFCNVGQGDAILVRRGFNQILIDGGPDERVLECLSDNLPFWDRTIEMVVLTHPQADHLTGLISVLERYEVLSFMVNNIVNDTERFWRFREVLIKEGAKIYNPKAGERIELAKMNFDVLWPKEELGSPLVWQRASQDEGIGEREFILGAATYSGNFNQTSVVLKLEFGDFCALLTGDIDQSTESQLDKVSPCQVLKVAHHGSKYSTSEEFLEMIRPDLAVISVGKNSFGHPTQGVIDKLRSIGARLLRTDQNGKIEIISDGEKWWILPERQ